ncbi:Dihydroxyacetone kinase family protein [Clostridiaceae bacterium JG1575]|nr:Dihydroxyacetone kinase family protein [Clostridiaceae bacterium JG1575]
MTYSVIDGQHFINMCIYASNLLEEKKAYVDSLNVFPVPDGDTGTNMSMTFRAAVDAVKDSKETNLAKVSRDLAKGALMGARGNSGVILSQIFRGIAKGFEELDQAPPEAFAKALKEGAQAAYRAVMRPTEGTILTVIREVGDAATAGSYQDMGELLTLVNRVAEETLNKTPDLLPQLKEAKVVDSGGMGLFIIFRGMQDALTNNLVAEVRQDVTASGSVVDHGAVMAQSNITYGYCTEFIVGGAIEDPQFQSFLEARGDSIVFVTMDDITKIHIHTEEPGVVMQEAQKHGELLKIKIENMREQNRQLHTHEESDFVKETLNQAEVAAPAKRYGFIAVAAGEGLRTIFEDLGCDVVIEGGQTMNPSTNDILNAVNSLNAEDIFILPNNKNIIMSANQCLDLTDKKLHVVPTKTIPQGISCLAAFNPEADEHENEELMMRALKEVKSAQITFAVRDTEIEGQKVHAGDYLGLLENKIKMVERDIYPMAERLIEEMVDKDTSVISVYHGKDTQEEEVNAFVEALSAKYPDYDVISYAGMQPLYYLILSVE